MRGGFALLIGRESFTRKLSYPKRRLSYSKGERGLGYISSSSDVRFHAVSISQWIGRLLIVSLFPLMKGWSGTSFFADVPDWVFNVTYSTRVNRR